MDNGVQHNKRVRGKISDIKLEQGSVIRIRGNPPFPSDKFHVFVVLNADPTGDCVLVTVNGTTQYEHRAQFYERIDIPRDKQPMLYIRANTYDFFSRDTWIDCHRVLAFKLSQVRRRNILLINEKVSDTDLQWLVQKVLESRRVKLRHKKLVDPNYVDHNQYKYPYQPGQNEPVKPTATADKQQGGVANQDGVVRRNEAIEQGESDQTGDQNDAEWQGGLSQVSNQEQVDSLAAA